MEMLKVNDVTSIVFVLMSYDYHVTATVQMHLAMERVKVKVLSSPTMAKMNTRQTTKCSGSRR